MSNYYFIEDCEKSRSQVFATKLKASDKQGALAEVLKNWSRLTKSDKKDRDQAFIIYADEDEEGCVDWDTVRDLTEIWNGKEDQIFANSEGMVFTEKQWISIVQTMDDDIREELNQELSPCSMQEFFTAYADAHQQKFGEQWELDKGNPCW